MADLEGGGGGVGEPSSVGRGRKFGEGLTTTTRDGVAKRALDVGARRFNMIAHDATALPAALQQQVRFYFMSPDSVCVHGLMDWSCNEWLEAFEKHGGDSTDAFIRQARGVHLHTHATTCHVHMPMYDMVYTISSPPNPHSRPP